MIFREYEPDLSQTSSEQMPQGGPKKKETSHNLRLILLAIQLQRPVKNLPAHLISAKRITKGSLAEEYLSEGNSASPESAKKMAGRHLKYMDEVFGLYGSNKDGFVMSERFENFRSMFDYWLNQIGRASASDRRLHVMLTGLIRAIGNGLRNDPVSIPNLAKQLKEKYKNANIRDSKDPLEDLFYNDILSSYLSLYDDDDDQMHINKAADPLLLRLKPRSIVGDNRDISINLALPGRLRLIFNDHIEHLNDARKNIATRIANAVSNSQIWKNESGHKVIPYIFYREGENGPLILTIWNSEHGHYEDIPFKLIQDVPDQCQSILIPYEMPENMWAQFRQIV